MHYYKIITYFYTTESTFITLRRYRYYVSITPYYVLAVSLQGRDKKVVDFAVVNSTPSYNLHLTSHTPHLFK